MTITAIRAEAAAGSVPAAAAPAWSDATFPDVDGSVMYMSAPTTVGTTSGDGVLDVMLTRLDDEDETGATTVALTVTRGSGIAHGVDLSPEQVLGLIEVLRDNALLAAYPDGVEMPVERVRLDDELLTPDGWQVVEIVDVDGWLTGGHPSAVRVNTDAHEDDDEGFRFAIGTPVRVRKAAA